MRYVGRDTHPSNSNIFTEGERVLAFHGPRIYEAKVQKVELLKKEWKYFVHDLGCNKHWDEWVGADRLMKLTEENVLKQEAVDKKQDVDKISRSVRSSQSKPKSSADAKADKEDLKNTAAKVRKRKSDWVLRKTTHPWKSLSRSKFHQP